MNTRKDNRPTFASHFIFKGPSARRNDILHARGLSRRDSRARRDPKITSGDHKAHKGRGRSGPRILSIVLEPELVL